MLCSSACDVEIPGCCADVAGMLMFNRVQFWTVLVSSFFANLSVYFSVTICVDARALVPVWLASIVLCRD